MADEHSPALLSETEARAMLGGIGRTMFFELLKSGKLKSVNIGRRRFVTMQYINEYVEKLSSEAANG